MLIDDVTITVKAGNGGNGKLSFRRNAQTARGGPDGGNGGRGGDVYLQGVSDITVLKQFRFKKSVKAEDGVSGGKNNLYGRNGLDLVIHVPLGTLVTDLSRKRSFEITDSEKRIRVADGGKGGRGNNEFKTSTDQAPYYAEKGEPGEEKQLHLLLRLIADIGLIGLPNAGKSSLLSVLTNAHPKIADYPFTTLEPNLGVMNGYVLADIPGLIEGAHTGKGLGVKFLKHIEKTRLLLHCIDCSSADVSQAYTTVRAELESYSQLLHDKPEAILLTKIDLIDAKTLKQKQKELSRFGKQVLSVSAYDDVGLTTLQKQLGEIVI